MMSGNIGVKYKLVLLGHTGVGKTSLLNYFYHMSDQYPKPTGSTLVDFRIKFKTVEVDGINVNLEMWDIAGGERLYTLTRSYFRGAGGCLLIFDVTSKRSFERIAQWFVQNKDRLLEGLQVILVGNKVDRKTDRRVEYEKGKELAENHGVTYIETSATDGYNVEQTFVQLIARMQINKKTPDENQPT